MRAKSANQCGAIAPPILAQSAVGDRAPAAHWKVVHWEVKLRGVPLGLFWESTRCEHGSVRGRHRQNAQAHPRGYTQRQARSTHRCPLSGFATRLECKGAGALVTTSQRNNVFWGA
jgi:hypothetical protein